MNGTSWIVGICLSLLLIGGVALDVSAQQPPPPPAPSETTPTPANPPTPSNPTPPTPRTEYGGQPQAPPTGSQIETRPVPLDGSERGSFLGVDPTVAMIIGAVLVIVIVFALVAMGRRSEEVRHTRHQA
jgi:hypothetical protein